MSIVITDLCKRFGSTPVLQRFTWTVDRPMVLMGRSGCGKTTLLRILLGLESADSGTVTGVETPAAVFQEDRLCPQLTAAANLMLTGHGLTPRDAERELRALGFTDAELALPAARLSGGQKRRVAIAGVLAMRPEVLILDEPTAGLDPKGRDEILDLITAMHKERGITILLVSHSMEDVAQYVERIIVMNHGQVMFDNTPCEVFKHYKELEQIGLAAPQVTYLMHELKEKGLNVNTEATTVAEARESLLEVLLGREPNHRGSNLEEENLC